MPVPEEIFVPGADEMKNCAADILVLVGRLNAASGDERCAVSVAGWLRFIGTKATALADDAIIALDYLARDLATKAETPQPTEEEAQP